MAPSQRELPTELEARIRRSAPRLPPGLRQRTLDGCGPRAAAAAPPSTASAASPPARFARPARAGVCGTWPSLRIPDRRRLMVALAAGFCVLQLVTASLMQPVSVQAGPDGRLTPASHSTADSVRLAFQARAARLGGYLNQLFR